MKDYKPRIADLLIAEKLSRTGAALGYGVKCCGKTMPSWAGLCSDAITKNIDGPHDMKSIRESIVRGVEQS